MASSAQLRKTRAGQVINKKSKGQEKLLVTALRDAVARLFAQRPELSDAHLEHEPTIKLTSLVERLETQFSGINFKIHFDSTSIRPDGGILYLKAKDGTLYPICIAEAKRQGTNDARKKEGKKKQSRGNAIERLGKNLIGIRTMMLSEDITPFVVFGQGCDFEEESSILDRVSTMALFGPLNQTVVRDVGRDPPFDRGSFYFREKAWEVSEMSAILLDIMLQSIEYYFETYGKEAFI